MKVFANFQVGGEPADRAANGVASLKPSVSASLDGCAVSTDGGLDSCKLKADTAVNNEARYVEIIAKP